MGPGQGEGAERCYTVPGRVAEMRSRGTDVVGVFLLLLDDSFLRMIIKLSAPHGACTPLFIRRSIEAQTALFGPGLLQQWLPQCTSLQCIQDIAVSRGMSSHVLHGNRALFLSGLLAVSYGAAPSTHRTRVLAPDSIEMNQDW
eukprot:727685-Pyramimonas_sp.AAC.1